MLKSQDIRPSLGEPHKTQTSLLVDELRKDIISGALPPGSKLLLRELSERYGVGSNPLREALSRLAMSGLVDSIDRRGFRVAKVSQQEVVDITRVRTFLEVEALRDAIANGDLTWEGQVLSAFHRLKRIAVKNTNGPGALNPDWEAAHEEFHQALLSACSSPWLLRLATLLREHSARYRHLSVGQHVETGVRNVLQEHQAIADAVLERDTDQACELLVKHLALTASLAVAQGAFR